MTGKDFECWAASGDYGPCAGAVQASLDFPDAGSYYCERHGHYEEDTEACMKAWDEKQPRVYSMQAEPGVYHRS